MLILPPSSLRAGDRVCVAISGGSDSTALLRLIHAANTLPKNALGIGLSAVHINHSLRGAESDAEQAFVTELCAGLKIPLYLQTVDTTAFAQTRKQTIEEAARSLRYEVFRNLLTTAKATHILTAHTLDDQAETVLMKLLRGAWLEGLSAIAPVLDQPPGQILRPLLSLRHEQLRDYLRTIQQPWREDSSNSDDAFTRNRIRQHILPVLREENPAIDTTLANLSELAREEEARWTVELAKLMPQLVLPGTPVRGGGRANTGAKTLAVELAKLRALDPALRRRVVRAASRELGARLSFDETTRILTLAGLSPSGLDDPTIPTKPGSKLTLSQRLVAERTLRELRLSIQPEK